MFPEVKVVGSSTRQASAGDKNLIRVIPATDFFTPKFPEISSGSRSTLVADIGDFPKHC